MKAIFLKSGERVLLDDEDYSEINRVRWFNTCGYARRKNKLMHRVIMKAPKGTFIDHIDGNRLNNQKPNLRFCTKKESRYNAAPKDGRKYKGISLQVGRRLWRVALTKEGKTYRSFGHPTPEAAALAYNKLAKKHFGPYARLNLLGG